MLFRSHLTSGFSLIEHVKEGPGSIGGTVVSDLLIERRTGRLWVAHENGVDILDRRTGRIVDRVPPSLFSNPKVTAMVQDKKDRVWMSTYSGILGFDPESRAYVKLGRENGLINNEFNFTSSGQLPDGRIIFGGLNGYDILEPGKFDFH